MHIDLIICIKNDKIYVDRITKLGTARNTGLNIAKGEYIIYLDGDDYLAEDNVLEKLNNLNSWFLLINIL